MSAAASIIDLCSHHNMPRQIACNAKWFAMPLELRPPGIMLDACTTHGHYMCTGENNSAQNNARTMQHRIHTAAKTTTTCTQFFCHNDVATSICTQSTCTRQLQPTHELKLHHEMQLHVHIDTGRNTPTMQLHMQPVTHIKSSHQNCAWNDTAPNACQCNTHCNEADAD